MPLLSLRAYARHRGVSLMAVQKAIRTRRIETVDGRIDPEIADLQWEQRTRPYRRAARQTDHTPGGLKKLTYSVAQEGVPRSAHLQNQHLARLAQIEYEERARRLVDRNEALAAMLTMARQIAPALVGQDDPARIERILGSRICAVFSMEGFPSAVPAPPRMSEAAPGRPWLRDG